MKTRNLLILALVAGFGFETSGCLRRRLVVVQEPYPAPVVVQQPVAVESSASAPEAPPPPKVEVAPVASAPSYVWVEGYWVWGRGWRWHRGFGL